MVRLTGVNGFGTVSNFLLTVPEFGSSVFSRDWTETDLFAIIARLANNPLPGPAEAQVGCCDVQIEFAR